MKAYKETILAQSRQIKALESEMQQTRQSLRYTKLVEYEMEVKTYFQEAMRLKRLLKHKEMGVEVVHESSEKLLRYDKIVEQLTEKLEVSENQIKMTEGINLYIFLNWLISFRTFNFKNGGAKKTKIVASCFD